MPEKPATSSLFEYEDGIRDDHWLEQRLQLIRSVHFADVPTGYPIDIRFGIRARYRFGSIAARNKRTVILINKLFAIAEVPEFVVDGTIGHEMAHYAHGFGSGLPRLHIDPHRGGVVDRELERRGLAEIERKADEWRKSNWDAFYAQHCSDLEVRRETAAELSVQLWDPVIHSDGARTSAELRSYAHRAYGKLGARGGEQVFEVDWLLASVRQTGTSYWFPKDKVVRVHGLLADRRVPDNVVAFEVSYWAARLMVGGSWPSILEALRHAGMADIAVEALEWRRKNGMHFGQEIIRC